MKIVFFGTPEFARASLEALVDSGYTVVAVVTAPDKPAGRGKQLTASAVKEYAVKKGLPVMQPQNLKDEHFLGQLSSLNADLFIVVAFRMLPAVVWQMPPKGTFNLHASLLPQYRGAAPINHAILNGEKTTGVTTFFIREEIDTGNIIFQEAVAIEDTDNAGSLHDKLMEIGSRLVLKTVAAIDSGNVKTVAQESVSSGTLKAAPKIFKETCRVNWEKSAQEVHHLVRGLSPYPAAWTAFSTPEGVLHSIKIFETTLSDALLTPGQVKQINDELMVGCGSGSVKILSLQASGKKRMSTAEFLRGTRIPEGTKAS